MLGILGRKIGMSRVIDEAGKFIPVTLVQCETAEVLQVKTQTKDGVSGLVLANGPRKHKSSNVTKNFKAIKQFNAVEDLTDIKKGDQIDLTNFTEGEQVQVISWTKGRGFQGVVKRHGFSGFPAGHGHRGMRIPGSIGMMKPRHVSKGRKMPGHMASVRKTLRSVQIIKKDLDNSLLALKGSIAGAPNTLVLISK